MRRKRKFKHQKNISQANEYCSWKPADEPTDGPVIKVTASAPPDEMTSCGKREPQKVKRCPISLYNERKMYEMGKNVMKRRRLT